jgi:hypothetical protein
VLQTIALSIDIAIRPADHPHIAVSKRIRPHVGFPAD